MDSKSLNIPGYHMIKILDTHPCPDTSDWEYSSVANSYQIRHEWQEKGMYAMVTWDWVNPLVKYIGKRRVIEVMSGAGWLAGALREKGVNIMATDNYSWADKRGWEMQTEVEKINCFKAIEQYGRSRSLLIMSWPYMDDKAYHCARLYHSVNPSGKIIYIGESQGGCTANDKFFSHTETVRTKSFQQVIYNYKTWFGVHDRPMLLKYKP